MERLFILKATGNGPKMLSLDSKILSNVVLYAMLYMPDYTRTIEILVSYAHFWKDGVLRPTHFTPLPSYDDLDRLDADGVREIPKACHFLLTAYHYLRKQSSGVGVTTRRWIEFWFKGALRYTKPKKRRRDSNNPPKLTGNPSGEIQSKNLEWTDEELKLFDILGIVHEGRRQSTYLAAFISCWLCNFVLPESNSTEHL
ncbi:hypothetical protein RND81_14G082800 [Saponaria officinalis]|uniref:Aminotransferase-like plant mobile domain-containing protein n=1 Tax=Saponaria officinalis TaxID=3572 RepID=A0AAW1GJP1_SAPOF